MKHPLPFPKTDHYVLVIVALQMLKKFGGIWAKRGIGGVVVVVVVGVRRRSLNSSLLDPPVSLQVFVSAEKDHFVMCVHGKEALHVQTSEELLSCSSKHNVPSRETFASSICFPRFHSPCCPAIRSRRTRRHLVYMAWRSMWDRRNASICSGLLCSKDSIKK